MMQTDVAHVPPQGRPYTGLAAMALLFVVLGIWHQLALRPYTGEFLPAPGPGGWEKVDMTADSWRPVFRGIDEERLERWRDANGAVVDRYTGLYRRQMQGREFSGYHNLPLGEGETNGWRYAGSFHVDEREFISPRVAQVVYAVHALASFRAPRSEVRVLRSACHPDCQSADRRLSEWADES